MYFLALGIALLTMKYLEIGPVAGWSWWIVMAPFALAAAWWMFADWSGYTRRKQEEKMADRVQDRHDRNKKALGMKTGERK